MFAQSVSHLDDRAVHRARDAGLHGLLLQRHDLLRVHAAQVLHAGAEALVGHAALPGARRLLFGQLDAAHPLEWWCGVG